ncbi:Uma2 family endonuclease, partial [Dolichospermum sp. ST_con]|nr:Uma2 family endonuclease [Dolichospermum sp. ST_con]
TPEGKLVPTPEESAEFEAERATIEAERSERLAAKLRELNIDPDTL